jgi:hypothetical protein
VGVIHDPKLFRIMAGTTGLEPATSAVTVKRKRVTNRKQGATDDSFSALRNPSEFLLHPYQTHDLCPDDLCPSIEIVRRPLPYCVPHNNKVGAMVGGVAGGKGALIGGLVG